MQEVCSYIRFNPYFGCMIIYKQYRPAKVCDLICIIARVCFICDTIDITAQLELCLHEQWQI